MNYLSTSQIDSINSRYSNRLSVHGDAPQTLGWSSKTQQTTRFERFTRYLSAQDFSLVDVGCGFGDLAQHLASTNYYPCAYLGIDINPKLLEVAHSRQLPFPSSFICSNILDSTHPVSPPSSFDYVVASGVFNLNFHHSLEMMEEFLFAMIDSMANISSKRVILDFIPDIRHDSYIAEEYIATYSLLNIHNFLSSRHLKYILDLSQDPNPMSEALLILDFS